MMLCAVLAASHDRMIMQCMLLGCLLQVKPWLQQCGQVPHSSRANAETAGSLDSNKGLPQALRLSTYGEQEKASTMAATCALLLRMTRSSRWSASATDAWGAVRP